MSTDMKELESLCQRMSQHLGVDVSMFSDANGHIETIQIFGAAGIGQHPMSPLAAAEAMREWLAKNPPNALHVAAVSESPLKAIEVLEKALGIECTDPGAFFTDPGSWKRLPYAQRLNEIACWLAAECYSLMDDADGVATVEEPLQAVRQ